MWMQPWEPITPRLGSGHSAPWMCWSKGHSVTADNPPRAPFWHRSPSIPPSSTSQLPLGARSSPPGLRVPHGHPSRSRPSRVPVGPGELMLQMGPCYPAA